MEILSPMACQPKTGVDFVVKNVGFQNWHGPACSHDIIVQGRDVGGEVLIQKPHFIQDVAENSKEKLVVEEC